MLPAETGSNSGSTTDRGDGGGNSTTTTGPGGPRTSIGGDNGSTGGYPAMSVEAMTTTTEPAAQMGPPVSQPAQTRPFGVQHILNPSQTRGAQPPVFDHGSAGGGAGNANRFGETRPLPRTRLGNDVSPSVKVEGSDYFSSQQTTSARQHSYHGYPGTPLWTSTPGAGPVSTPSYADRPTLGGHNMGPPDAERESPPLPAPPYSAYGAPRRILTPKSPRRISRSRAIFSSASEAPPVPSIPTSLLQQGVPGYDTSSGPYGGAPPPSTAAATPRSFTQPVFSSISSGAGPENRQEHLPPFQNEAQHAARQAYDAEPGRPAPSFPPPPSSHPQHQGGYGSGPTPGQSIPTSGSMGTISDDGSWQMPGAGGRSMVASPESAVVMGQSMSEGQQFITIKPSVGEEIRVPVDVHQASKQADEKRQRNAGASARFRARKKEKDREVQQGMQRLEAQNRELQKRIQGLEVQCEYYRYECNRLKQIMRQHSATRELADMGPASPALTTRSGGSYAADGSPMIAGAQHHQPSLSQSLSQSLSSLSQPSQAAQQQQQQPPPLYPPMSTAPISGPGGSGPGHIGLPSSMASAEPPFGIERPARRRRTDSGPNLDYQMAPYASSVPTTLPPLQPTGFQSMSPSPIPGSPSNPRLPPLRMDTPTGTASSIGEGRRASQTPEPMPGPSALPVPQHPPVTSAAYTTSAYPPRTYETGWVTGTQPLPPPPDPGYQR